jgi:hypothetical protein
MLTQEDVDMMLVMLTGMAAAFAEGRPCPVEAALWFDSLRKRVQDQQATRLKVVMPPGAQPVLPFHDARQQARRVRPDGLPVQRPGSHQGPSMRPGGRTA